MQIAQHHNPNFFFADQTLKPKPVRIEIETPPIGNKVHLIEERGIFVLEEGPCVWLGLSCTHAGSGGVIVYDGIPDADGFFPEPPPKPVLLDIHGRPIDRWIKGAHDYLSDDKGTLVLPTEAEEIWREYSKLMANRNGRPVSKAHPACLGMWMYSGGLQHGLTVEAMGEMQGTATMMTFTWHKPKIKNA